MGQIPQRCLSFKAYTEVPGAFVVAGSFGGAHFMLSSSKIPLGQSGPFNYPWRSPARPGLLAEGVLFQRSSWGGSEL